MEKIKFQTPDGTTEEFYVEEQTMIGGRSDVYKRQIQWTETLFIM